MHIYQAEELDAVRGAICERLAAGEVAILPTDTIYGLSGDVRSLSVVQRIARIKRRTGPAAFIPHDRDWARDLVAPSHRTLFDELLAVHKRATTLLLPKSALADRELPAPVIASNLVGLRIADHLIAELAREARTPLVSTSANVTTEPFMTSLEDLSPELAREVDFLLYEGERRARPSTLIFCDGRAPRVLHR